MTQLHPTSTRQRIQYLDILRGIAILFILLANIHFASGYIFLSDADKTSFSGVWLDKVLEYILHIFIEKKFYTIFSMLFGMGFALQFEKTEQNNRSFVPFFSRRMLVLLLFGALHLFFIWIGDILNLYALLGFFLILFRNCSDRQLLKWAVIMTILPIVHFILMAATETYYPFEIILFVQKYWDAQGWPTSDWMNIGREIGEPLYYLRLSDLGVYIETTNHMALFRWADYLIEGRPFKVFACFLVGVWAGRKILHADLLSNTVLLKKIVFWGFLIGLPMNAIMLIAGELGGVWMAAKEIAHIFGVIPLASAYAASIALWIQKRPQSLQWFAPVGRMALTNYVLQSFVFMTIFYGCGLGYAGYIEFWKVILIALGIFGLQVIGSMIWLQYFKYGPLEWIWRQLTYGRWIPNKK